ncbi:hypothetical protein, partial [Odoribacter laneus]|uniref:hypothetical protein n=1 Tax=Odoribacter laneus TaxID=626933 RepID=UPI003AF105B9
SLKIYINNFLFTFPKKSEHFPAKKHLSPKSQRSHKHLYFKILYFSPHRLPSGLPFGRRQPPFPEDPPYDFFPLF